MAQEKRKYIGQDCYLCLSSKAELVSADGCIHVPLSATEFKILDYFVTHANTPVYLEELAQHIWGSNYFADKKDPKSLTTHFVRIRKKLTRLDPALKDHFETNHGYNSYTYKIEQAALVSHNEDYMLSELERMVAGDKDDVAEYERVFTDVTHLNERMDSIVADLEVIQNKLDHARASNDQIWERIYSTQFDSLLLKLVYLKRELENQQYIAQRILSFGKLNRELEESLHMPLSDELVSYKATASENSGPSLLCRSSPELMLRSVLCEAKDLAHFVDEIQVMTEALAIEVDELIN